MAKKQQDSKQKFQISYEPEADILSWELNDKDIDYAEEIGNVVVHFTEKGVPVMIEILNAKNFLQKTASMVKKRQPSRMLAFS